MEDGAMNSLGRQAMLPLLMDALSNDLGVRIDARLDYSKNLLVLSWQNALGSTYWHEIPLHTMSGLHISAKELDTLTVKVKMTT